MTQTNDIAEFELALINACEKTVSRIPKIVGDEQVYAFAVYSTNDFAGFASAIATEEGFTRRPKHPGGLDPATVEMLKDHPDLLAKVDLTKDPSGYLRVTAAEWDYIGKDDGAFDPLNELVDKIHDDSKDSEWAKTKSAFLKAILATLKHLRTHVVSDNACFTPDVLLTFQWADIGTDEPELLSMAKAVNSPQWCNILEAEWGGNTSSYAIQSRGRHTFE